MFLKGYASMLNPYVDATSLWKRLDDLFNHYSAIDVVYLTPLRFACEGLLVSILAIKVTPHVTAQKILGLFFKSNKIGKLYICAL